MSRNISSYIPTVFFFLVIGGCVFYAMRSSNSKVNQVKRETELVQAKLAEIEDMVDRHNAGRSMLEFELADEWLTIRVQRLILKNKDKPQLLFTEIRDIGMRDGKYYITGENFDGFIYHLSCSAEMAENIIGARGSSWNQVALIILPTKAFRPVLELFAEPDYDDAYLSAGTTSIMVIKGECLDFVRTGDQFYGVQDLMKDSPEDRDSP